MAGSPDLPSIDDRDTPAGAARGQRPAGALPGTRQRPGPTGSGRWRTLALRALVGLAVLAAALAALEGRSAPAAPGGPDPAPRQEGTVGAPAGSSTRLHLGVTHTQHSADPWNDPGAVASAQDYLRSHQLFQNQHIMGFGVLNPEPSPDAYDFSSLDRRMDLIRSTGGTPVVTLCCAPDWMKGGQAGRTDWSRIEDAPDPGHYGDFAELAAEVARRYPWVRHYLVWNELKGFWNDDQHRWDYEGYTELYNQVYAALKDVDPGLQVGGPYAVLNSYADPHGNVEPSALRGPWGTVDQRDLDAVTYWLQHHRGADFLAVDTSTATNDQGLITDPFTATGKFTAVAEWVRQRSQLPLWWAEWYVDGDESDDWDQNRWTAVRAAALIDMSTSGSTVALLWQPEGTPDCHGCLWSSTRPPDGGQPQPFGEVYADFQQHFPPGTRLVDTPVAGPAVPSVASPDHAILVNPTATRLDVTVDDQELTLEPYQVRSVTR